MSRVLARARRGMAKLRRRGDLAPVEKLVSANLPGMLALFAQVEAERGPAERVIVLRADRPGPPDIFVHLRENVVAELRKGGHLAHAEQLEGGPAAGAVHALVGTARVLCVVSLARGAP